MHDNQEEMFPVVNALGEVVGCATRGECHSGSHLLHPVVHLHVFNNKGEVYLQKLLRSWTTTTRRHQPSPTRPMCPLTSHDKTR